MRGRVPCVAWHWRALGPIYRRAHAPNAEMTSRASTGMRMAAGRLQGGWGVGGPGRPGGRVWGNGVGSDCMGGAHRRGQWEGGSALSQTHSQDSAAIKQLTELGCNSAVLFARRRPAARARGGRPFAPRRATWTNMPRGRLFPRALQFVHDPIRACLPPAGGRRQSIDVDRSRPVPVPPPR